MQPLTVYLSILLLVLFPLTVYLAVLGWINRRPHGMLVSGSWDFAGILFAASGFLLFGGPALLDSLTQTDVWRYWLLSRSSEDRPIEERLAPGRLALFAGYFLLVVGGSVFFLWRRRRLTAIYNVHPNLVETVLGQTFEQLHLSFLQTGNVLLIEPDPSPLPPAAPPSASPDTPPQPAPLPPSLLLEKVTTLEVEASAGMCHVSLWWDPPGSLLRREVEQQLHRALAQRPAPDAGVGDWLFLVASTLLFLLLAGGGILLLFRHLFL